MIGFATKENNRTARLGQVLRDGFWLGAPDHFLYYNNLFLPRKYRRYISKRLFDGPTECHEACQVYSSPQRLGLILPKTL